MSSFLNSKKEPLYIQYYNPIITLNLESATIVLDKKQIVNGVKWPLEKGDIDTALRNMKSIYKPLTATLTVSIKVT